MDKSRFFIRPFHAREEDKALLDKEMKRLCYLGILKEGFSAYSIPVMLVSRKLTKDKRVITDFRHLNMRIAKNNLAYPLLKDTFTLLGSSKGEVLSVLDLEDVFHSLRLTEKSKKYCGILLCRAVHGKEFIILFICFNFSCLGVNYCIYSVYCNTQLLVFRFSFLR